MASTRALLLYPARICLRDCDALRSIILAYGNTLEHSGSSSKTRGTALLHTRHYVTI